MFTIVFIMYSDAKSSRKAKTNFCSAKKKLNFDLNRRFLTKLYEIKKKNYQKTPSKIFTFCVSQYNPKTSTKMMSEPIFDKWNSF